LEPALFIWEAKMAKVSEKKLLDQVPLAAPSCFPLWHTADAGGKTPSARGIVHWDEAKAAVIAVMQENKRKKS
jgi:hypothetical protein